MSRYYFSLLALLFLLPIQGRGQDSPIDLQPTDTVTYKDEFGLRAGIDLSKLVLSFIDEGYTGLELVGDYRLSRKLYLAAEIGNESKTQDESLYRTLLYDYKSSGSYIKAGVDLNTYENWFGMDNAITLGGRYAFSTFSQTLNDYNLYNSNHFYQGDFLPGAQPGQKFSGLSASWIELVVGLKVELFANIYLGMSTRLGFLVSNKEDPRFPNLWIPGFNKVTEGSNFGVNYNYSITYFLPLYKKDKKKKEAPEPPGGPERP